MTSVSRLSVRLVFLRVRWLSAETVSGMRPKQMRAGGRPLAVAGRDDSLVPSGA